MHFKYDVTTFLVVITQCIVGIVIRRIKSLDFKNKILLFMSFDHRPTYLPVHKVVGDKIHQQDHQDMGNQQVCPTATNNSCLKISGIHCMPNSQKQVKQQKKCQCKPHAIYAKSHSGL
jgi:hypothetical protein